LFEEAYVDVVEFCILHCSERYGFDKEIARRFVLSQPIQQFILPFTGYIDKNKCQAVKYAGGLHIQCMVSNMKDSDYCIKHNKEAQKNDNNKPSVGDIRDRKKCSLLDYIDFKKRRTKPYIEFINKNKKYTKDECLYEAKKRGITIPVDHWAERMRRRGRPKKERIIAVSDTDSDSDDSIIDRVHAGHYQNESFLIETPEGLLDEELGFLYSKTTHKLIKIC